ncbi:MAG: phosphoribosyltransferase [Candidatus Eremiobacteraeota bacterium]|nr:phosphoribosyltransferase [Candidatus Eremiobacteraeota bacterium]
MALLRDRAEAGHQLAVCLHDYTDDAGAIVLALPRGGVPVGYEVAMALHLPLDVYVVRKLGVPGHEELAMGAIASDGTYVVDPATLEMARVNREALEETLQREAVELRRRSAAYREDRPEPEIAGKRVIVVDDGLATGASMFAATRAIRARDPAAVIVAVPVAPAETVEWLRGVADRVICPHEFQHFGAVGLHYDDFAEVSDDDVRSLLTARNNSKVS